MATQEKNYSELLKDPRWQKLRLKVMERDEFKCQSCFDSENTLNVHHKKYVYGNKPWEYDETELITLCETCHERTEFHVRDINKSIRGVRSTKNLSIINTCTFIMSRCDNEELNRIAIYLATNITRVTYFKHSDGSSVRKSIIETCSDNLIDITEKELAFFDELDKV